MKRCSSCKDPKSFDLFCKDSKSGDGHQSVCKSCKNDKLSKYYKNIPLNRHQRLKYKNRERYYRNKVSWNFSRQIRKVLKNIGGKMGYGWERIVGYNLSDLKQHLESKFKNGMNWNNYGEWHIDHERPISSFNITSIGCDDFNKCWSLSNLQPLWAKENISKSNKYISKVQEINANPVGETQ